MTQNYSEKVTNVTDKQSLQDDLDKLVKRSEKWQMLFNCGKCKCIHIVYGNMDEEYKIKNKTSNLQTSNSQTSHKMCVCGEANFQLTNFLQNVCAVKQTSNLQTSKAQTSNLHTSNSQTSHNFVQLCSTSHNFAGVEWSGVENFQFANFQSTNFQLTDFQLANFTQNVCGEANFSHHKLPT